jgi:hypothetical protein
MAALVAVPDGRRGLGQGAMGTAEDEVDRQRILTLSCSTCAPAGSTLLNLSQNRAFEVAREYIAKGWLAAP